MTRPVLALLCALVLSACDFEQVIELDLPPYEPRLVVGGFPAPDSVFTVRLGRSAGALEPTSPDGTGLLVTTARIAVFDEDGAFLDSLYQSSPFFDDVPTPGVYRSVGGLQPIPGRAYTLRAEAPDLPSVEATTRLPEPVPFRVRFDHYVDVPEFGEAARLVVALPDPPGPHTYRLFVEAEGDDLDGVARRSLVFFRSDDPLLRSSFEELDLAVDIEVELDPDRDRFFNQALFRDVLFDGETREIVLDAPLPIDGSGEAAELVVTLASLSDDYVRYQQTLALQDLNRDNPFAEPVRIHTNVEGGLGVFAGYTPVSTYVDFTEPRSAPGRQ